MEKCRWCGMVHGGQPYCPSVKALEFFPDGSVKRVEFFTPADYQPLQIQPVEGLQEKLIRRAGIAY